MTPFRWSSSDDPVQPFRSSKPTHSRGVRIWQNFNAHNVDKISYLTRLAHLFCHTQTKEKSRIEQHHLLISDGLALALALLLLRQFANRRFR
jgi:hypothetical protein